MEPNHHHKKYANQELLWYPYDDVETYNKNLIERHEDLVRLGWLDRTITYKFNSNGFRSAEFQEGSIVYLGCSITFGIGLPLENIFPSLVSDKLELHCCNLAVSGSSNDTAFRLAEYWLSRIKPKMVILMSPDSSRIELVGKEIINYRPSSSTSHMIYYQRWLMDNENARLNQLKNSLAIEQICNSMGIKFLMFTIENDFCFIENDLARDLSHPGLASHAKMADLILDRI